jgi:isopenicillin-N epimerase
VSQDIIPIDTEPWMLDSSITYLNHGSFGARVRSISSYQSSLREEFEASPVHFLDRKKELLVQARRTVSTFLHADFDSFGFVDNATTGIGCVLHSLPLNASDEILTTTHVYNGVRQLLQRKSDDSGCSYREIEVPLPVESKKALAQLITSEITDATSLLVIDHVASASAIVFPVEEIVRYCKDKGVLVLVDGAHAPGMLDVNIDAIDADWYVGNLHKWVCAPVGAGFIYASKEHRASTHPMTVSHFYGQGFTNEFDWQGTKDITPWLTAAKAIAWGSAIGWDRIRAHNHSLATWMQQALVSAWNVEPLSPLDGSMLGNMATVRLPNGSPHSMEFSSELSDRMYEVFQIEVPFFEMQGFGAVRVSAQLYSRKLDIARLIYVFEEISL